MLRFDRKRINRVCFIFFAILLILGCFTPFSRSFFGLPTHHHVLVGEPLVPSLHLPAALTAALQWQIDRTEATKTVEVLHPDGLPVVQQAGEYCLSLKLFGLIPLRHMMVTAVPEMKVIPGGQSIGVLLHSKGVLVVGEAPIRTQNQGFSPARRAGIREGDLILAINGRQVQNESDVRELVNEIGGTGERMKVRVKRNGREFQVHLTPDFCRQTGRYRVGLLVRDTAAGVGTLTFYEPETKSYGALGHVIAAGRTSQRIELTDGNIVEAEIQGVRSGTRGRPGEKVGVFSNRDLFTGSIDLNTTYGIFGTLNGEPINPYFEAPVPIALLHHIRTGPAETFTVLQGRKIERFTLLIEEVRPEATGNGKGLVIKINDERLLEKSGGIIQGMSGSPIVQNGCLIGAITHVFINNPTRGYGVPVEWMLRECGLLELMNEINPSEEWHRAS